MKDDLFQELVESVREGGAILRGDAAPARAFSVDDPDVAEVRELYGLSQSKFAGLLGISVRTLQNWEQHRRRPDGPARVLLRVAARHPEAVLDVVREEPVPERIEPSHRVSRKGRKKATRRRANQRVPLSVSNNSRANAAKVLRERERRSSRTGSTELRP